MNITIVDALLICPLPRNITTINPITMIVYVILSWHEVFMSVFQWKLAVVILRVVFKTIVMFWMVYLANRLYVNYLQGLKWDLLGSVAILRLFNNSSIPKCIQIAS